MTAKRAKTLQEVRHFVVVWRRLGPLVQVMDPGTGRRWITSRQLLDALGLEALAFASKRKPVVVLKGGTSAAGVGAALAAARACAPADLDGVDSDDNDP